VCDAGRGLEKEGEGGQRYAGRGLEGGAGNGSILSDDMMGSGVLEWCIALQVMQAWRTRNEAKRYDTGLRH
jgi:hypothetical protein